MPIGGGTGPVLYRKSWVNEVGYDEIPNDLDKFLDLCQKLQKSGHPFGMSLGHALGDANGYSEWLLWTHNAFVVDEKGKVALDSKETIAALKYATELQKTMIPGTLTWNDVGNNQAYTAGADRHDVQRRVALLRAAEVAGPEAAARSPPTPITQDTPFGDVEAQAAVGGADERDGVQAQQVSERRQGISALHDGGRPVRPVAVELPRLLVPVAEGVQPDEVLGLRIRSWSRSPVRWIRRSTTATRGRSAPPRPR